MSLYTSEELYVLASLLGRDFIIGVEDNTLENSRTDLKELYTKNFRNLEARGVFDLKIDGTLFVDHEVRTMVRVLNKADNVVVVLSDVHGSLEKANYLKYANEFCKLVDKGSSYLVESIEKFDVNSILNLYKIRLSNTVLKSVSTTLEQFKEFGELYNSFNQSEADKFLCSAIQDPMMIDLIRKCMLKRSDFFILKEYKRINNHMVVTDSLILRFVDEYIMRFDIENGNTVNMHIYQKEY